MKTDQYVVITGMLLIFAILGSPTAGEARASSDISHKQAIEIANKEVIKLGYNLSELNATVDEQNSNLQKTRDRLKKDRSSSRPEAQRILDEYEKKLAGHTYWTVGYSFKPRNGNTVLGGTQIYIDPSNGEVLLVIHGH